MLPLCNPVLYLQGSVQKRVHKRTVYFYTVLYFVQFSNNIYFPKCTSHVTYTLATLTTYNRCLYHRSHPLKHGHYQPMAHAGHLLVNLFKVDTYIILVSYYYYDFNHYIQVTYQLYYTDVQQYYEINYLQRYIQHTYNYHD